MDIVLGRAWLSEVIVSCSVFLLLAACPRPCAAQETWRLPEERQHLRWGKRQVAFSLINKGWDWMHEWYCFPETSVLIINFKACGRQMCVCVVKRAPSGSNMLLQHTSRTTFNIGFAMHNINLTQVIIHTWHPKSMVYKNISNGHNPSLVSMSKIINKSFKSNHKVRFFYQIYIFFVSLMF